MRFTLSLLCLTAVAWAQPLAILPLEGASESGGVYRRALTKLNKAPIAHRGVIAMTLEEARVSFSCFDEGPACMSQIGQVLEAKRLAWGKLERLEDLWVLHFRLLDVDRSALLSSVTLVKPAEEGALEAFEDAIVQIAQGKPVAKEIQGRLYVTSEPAGAVIKLDGVAHGATPRLLDVKPGPHALELFKPGYLPKQLKIQMGDRVKRLSLRLPTKPNPEAKHDPEVAKRVTQPPPPSTKRSKLFWGGVGMAGAAAASAGIGLIYGLKMGEIEGREDWETKPVDDPDYVSAQDDFNQAKTITNTALITAGVTAAISATLFYLDSADD